MVEGQQWIFSNIKKKTKVNTTEETIFKRGIRQGMRWKHQTKSIIICISSTLHLCDCWSVTVTVVEIRGQLWICEMGRATSWLFHCTLGDAIDRCWPGTFPIHGAATLFIPQWSLIHSAVSGQKHLQSIIYPKSGKQSQWYEWLFYFLRDSWPFCYSR